MLCYLNANEELCGLVSNEISQIRLITRDSNKIYGSCMSRFQLSLAQFEHLKIVRPISSKHRDHKENSIYWWSYENSDSPCITSYPIPPFATCGPYNPTKRTTLLIIPKSHRNLRLKVPRHHQSGPLIKSLPEVPATRISQLQIDKFQPLANRHFTTSET
jgi:hypothetical protein